MQCRQLPTAAAVGSCAMALTSREAAFLSGGISRLGLASKKLTGLRKKPVVSTGMTGQSSMRGMWVTPKACQMTQSASAMLRFCRRAAEEGSSQCLLIHCSNGELRERGGSWLVQESGNMPDDTGRCTQGHMQQVMWA